MLSLLKMASAFVFVRRSCSSRSLLIGRPIRTVRSRRSDPRPARPIEDGALGGDQLPVVAALEDLVVRADDPDVRVPGPAALPLLADLEERVDAARFWRWAHASAAARAALMTMSQPEPSGHQIGSIATPDARASARAAGSICSPASAWTVTRLAAPSRTTSTAARIETSASPMCGSSAACW